MRWQVEAMKLCCVLILKCRRFYFHISYFDWIINMQPCYKHDAVAIIRLWIGVDGSDFVLWLASVNAYISMNSMNNMTATTLIFITSNSHIIHRYFRIENNMCVRCNKFQYYRVVDRSSHTYRLIRSLLFLVWNFFIFFFFVLLFLDYKSELKMYCLLT